MGTYDFSKNVTLSTIKKEDRGLPYTNVVVDGKELPAVRKIVFESTYDNVDTMTVEMLAGSPFELKHGGPTTVCIVPQNGFEVITIGDVTVCRKIEPSEERDFKSKDGQRLAVVTLTRATKDEIITRVLKFFADHECWSGEAYMQADQPQIDSAEFLSELLDDVIKAEIVDSEEVER